MKPKIIILTGEKLFVKYIYNGIKDSFEIEKVVLEIPETISDIYKKRAKRIGKINIIGQKLFDKYIVRYLAKSSIPRIRQIKNIFKLDSSKIPEEKLMMINSVNSPELISLLQLINPNIIIVNNTRIINKAVLSSVNGIFINIHSGILPRYRGYSGGYWALVKNDKLNCGSTIHIVDEKIDNGPIICQGLINIDTSDNYFTYAFHHAALEIELLKKAISRIVNNDINFNNNSNNPPMTKLRYGPTIWGYIYNRFFRKVK